MEPNDKKLKQATFILITNLSITVWAFTVAVKSFGGLSVLREVMAICGFLGFFALTMLLFLQVLKLRNGAKV